jgi:hypothetical protein
MRQEWPGITPGASECDSNPETESVPTLLQEVANDLFGLEPTRFRLFSRYTAALRKERTRLHRSPFLTQTIPELKHDTRLLRVSRGTPKNVGIYGYLFNINTEALTLIVEDRVAWEVNPPPPNQSGIDAG